MFNINETFLLIKPLLFYSGANRVRGQVDETAFYSEAALEQQLMWTNRNRLKAVISCGPIQPCGM
jgi:hypothetical protein